MKKLLILCALLAVAAAPAFAQTNPGIDLTANGFCSTTASNTGQSDGGALTAADCAARATAGTFVTLYCTLIPAEPISDASGIDGELDIAIVGDWTQPSGQFWDMGPTGCMTAAGAAPTISGVRPTTAGVCGTALTVKQAWGTTGVYTTTVDDASHERVFYTMSVPATSNIAAGQRMFGYSLTYDPLFSADGGQGGTCGTCQTPICFTTQGKPASFNGNPTTNLSSGTGNPGVTNRAFYNAGCVIVPTTKGTWGKLKSLYR